MTKTGENSLQNYKQNSLENTWGNSLLNFWIIVRFYYKSGSEHFLDEALQASSSAFMLLAAMVIFQFSGTLNAQIITYLLFGNLLYVITNPRIDWILGNIIRDGKLPNYLLPPLSLFTHFLGHGLANSWFGFLISCLSLGPLLLLFLGKINLSGLSFGNLLIFICLGIVTFLLRTALQMLIAFTTFLTKEVAGSVAVYMNLELFLAGTLFPISVLAAVITPAGQFWQNAIYAQPLAFIVYHPMQIILGNYNHKEIVLVLLGALFWTVFCCFLTIFSFHQAKKKGLLG